MSKITALSDLTNLSNETTVVNTINTNNDRIESALANTLSLDGSTPNSMLADLDMNSNQILNLPAATVGSEPIRKTEFDTEIDRIDLAMEDIVSLGVADNTITNARLSDMAQSTIKGRAEGAGTGDPQDLTPTQVKALLDVNAVSFFATRTEAVAASIPSDIEAITVFAYGSGYPACVISYDRVAVEPSHGGKFQSADGAWWELLPSGSEVNLLQFGAKGDPGTDTVDDTAAWVAATTYIDTKVGFDLDLTPGTFRINAGIAPINPPRIKGRGDGFAVYSEIPVSVKTKLKWFGGATPIIDLTNVSFGGFLKDVWVDCGATASVALQVIGSIGFEVCRVALTNLGARGIVYNGTLLSTCSFHRIEQLYINGASSGESALEFRGVSGGGNACHITLDGITINWGFDRHGIVLGGCDNIVSTGHIFLQGSGITTGKDVYCDPTDISGFPTENVFAHLEASSTGVYIETGSTACPLIVERMYQSVAPTTNGAPFAWGDTLGSFYFSEDSKVYMQGGRMYVTRSGTTGTPDVVVGHVGASGGGKTLFISNNAVVADIGNGGLHIGSGATVSTIDTDGTLAANSDTRLSTQKAIKTYVDQIVASTDAMVFKGVIDCSTNPNYPAADRGHTYRVSVAGKIGGASGINVEASDLLICLTDGTVSGDQATVGTSWAISQANLDGAVIGPASATADNLASYNSTTGKLIKDSGLPSTSTGTGSLARATSPTITGLTIGNTGGNSSVIINKAGSGYGSYFIGNSNGVSRWSMIFGDGTAESGSNVGSDFYLLSYNDAGTFLGLPLTVYRSSMEAVFGGKLTSKHATGGVGYSTGAGGAVTQGTSRTTGVTLNKAAGAITLFSAAGSTTPATFTVTNSAVEATDTVTVVQKSGTDLYHIHVTAVAAGSFNITFYTTGGTTTEQPVFNFTVIKGAAS